MVMGAGVKYEPPTLAVSVISAGVKYDPPVARPQESLVKRAVNYLASFVLSAGTKYGPPETKPQDILGRKEPISSENTGIREKRELDAGGLENVTTSNS